MLMWDTYTRRARFALWRLAAMLAGGSTILLDLAAIAALNAQIGLALNINYNQPIAVIQKRLETLRKFRIRYTQAICLTMTLTWMPIFVVVLKGFLGLDVCRLFGTTWILVNVAFGLAVLVLGLWLAKKFGPRMNNAPFGQRFLGDIAGYNLTSASGFLATLAKFEEERFDR
jgi:hypothetical protein